MEVFPPSPHRRGPSPRWCIAFAQTSKSKSTKKYVPPPKLSPDLNHSLITLMNIHAFETFSQANISNITLLFYDKIRSRARFGLICCKKQTTVFFCILASCDLRFWFRADTSFWKAQIWALRWLQIKIKTIFRYFCHILLVSITKQIKILNIGCVDNLGGSEIHFEVSVCKMWCANKKCSLQTYFLIQK